MSDGEGFGSAHDTGFADARLTLWLVLRENGRDAQMHNVDALNGSLQAAQTVGLNRATSRPDADRATRPASEATPTRTNDSVELSAGALDSSRAAAIARVRAEIAAGTYLTDDRLDGAISGLLEDLR
ncbi:MAG: hypothetical protein KDA20_08110 [Phycisphaerales bacterium]|nr:hypothetical protein [Phycisphaerales bacterium]